jgi:hypothetical protein
MKLTVRVVVHADEGTEAVVREAFLLHREEPLALEILGLQLAEAQDLLAAVGGHPALLVQARSTLRSAPVNIRNSSTVAYPSAIPQ